MKKIRRLPRAIEDLDQIWFRIFKDNPEAADRLVEHIAAATARLLDFPDSGSPKPEILADLRSIPVGSYVIYYRVTAQTVDVLRIIHSARDVGKLIFD